MANDEHVAILRQGVETWNRWRAGNDLRPDLGEAPLEHLDLSEANLGGAHKAHSMCVDFRKYPWFLGPPLEFLSTEEIVAQLPQGHCSRRAEAGGNQASQALIRLTSRR